MVAFFACVTIRSFTYDYEKRSKDTLRVRSGQCACRNFVETLRKALTGWDITAGTAKLKTRLFEARKYNLVHYFHPPVPRAASFLRSLTGGIRKVQTILGPPERPEDYKHIIAAQRVVVFSEQEKLAAQKAVPDAVVECILPCVTLPDMNLLQPSSEVRQHYRTGDKFLVIALSDICSKQDFDNFIYVMREYNRRGEFRLLVPSFKKTKTPGSGGNGSRS